MKNRLLKKIAAAQRLHSKLFCAFLTLGYPNLRDTERLIFEFEKSGVDIVELGIPFSDPLADGPTIQYSSEYALAKGIQMKDAFQVVQSLRRKGCRVPILCFSYLNPIYQFGLKRFPLKAVQSGFDGLIVPDLPPEAEKDLNRRCRAAGLAQIFLVAPTTDPRRASVIDRSSQGFVYYVSLRGVTGARHELPKQVAADLGKIRSFVKHPLLIGFGISSPVQSHFYSRLSSGVIVGSALVDQIRKNGNKIQGVIPFIQQMVKAAKQ